MNDFTRWTLQPIVRLTFRMIRATKFTVNRQFLDILDTDCPQPANLVTVTIGHLLAQNDQVNDGRRSQKC